jgi:hypothetical protein
MRYLKLYEEFVSSDTPVNYKKGEFEIKELFRIFAKIQDRLPKEIDRSIFDMSKEDFGEPREFERHIDPKFESEQYTTDELLNIKEFTIEDERGKVKVDSEKYKSFIKFCQQLFNKGQLVQTTRQDVEKIAKDSNSIGRGDFGDFLKDVDLIKKLQSSYDKSTGELSKHGFTIYQTGLFDKFPELKDDIRRAGKYDYYQNTWNILDKQIKEGQVSASSVLEIDGKMYLVGGNRRMAFYIGSSINPKIWKIKL